MTKDPVCGMEIRSGPVAWLLGLSHPRVEEKPIKFQYEGREYVFCSKSCLKEFEAEPAQFLVG